MDIGAFTVPYDNPIENKEWFELYTRWYQFGAFCPIFRSHGTTTPIEIWYFGEAGSEYYDTQLKFNQLRYRLLPYIYSLAGHAVIHDYTIMRALVMDFRDDKNVYDVPDQYMFGPYLLINPVTEPEVENRKVYLPKGGDWCDFWTGYYYKGGQKIIVDTPIESMPIFVKAGAILPMGPFIQYTTEKPDAPIELRIYPGVDGQFELYEDENDNYNYEKSKYSIIPISYDDKNGIVTIHKRTGSFEGMIQKRVFKIIIVRKNHGIGNEVTEKPDQIINYDGSERRLKIK